MELETGLTMSQHNGSDVHFKRHSQQKKMQLSSHVNIPSVQRGRTVHTLQTLLVHQGYFVLV